MEKLIKTSRVIDGFVKAFRGICFGFAVAVVILLAVELVLPQAQFEKFVTTSDMMVDFGTVVVHTGQELSLQGPVRMAVAGDQRCHLIRVQFRFLFYVCMVGRALHGEEECTEQGPCNLPVACLSVHGFRIRLGVQRLRHGDPAP